MLEFPKRRVILKDLHLYSLQRLNDNYLKRYVLEHQHLGVQT